MKTILITSVCIFALLSCTSEDQTVNDTTESTTPVDTLIAVLQIGTAYSV